MMTLKNISILKILSITTLLLFNGCGGSDGSNKKNIVYVIDAGEDRIASFSSFSGSTFSGTFGSSGSGVGQFSLPLDIAIHEGKIYILDSLNHRIVRIDNLNGDGWISFGSLGAGTNQFNTPEGFFIDSNGLIYIADTNNHRIVRINDITGAGWGAFGSLGTGALQFNDPSDVVVNGDILFVADCGNDRISSVNIVTEDDWITFGTTGSGTNQLNCPTGIDLDSNGQIYVADFFNNRIVRINNMAGAGFVATPSGLGQPRNVHIGPEDQIYTSAYNGGSKVFRFDDMSLSNLVEFGSNGSGDGQFGNPASIFVIRN